MSKSAYVFIALFATMPMGLLGAFLGYMGETSNAITGFLWGVGIAVVLCVVMLIGYIVWDWIKQEASKGRMRPYMLCGFLVAIAISGWFAWGLGDSTCIESTDPDGRPTTCLEYADDGFEATTEQRWSEFWSKLPATLIIFLLIAYIAHGQTEKSRRKHFKSKIDDFAVSTFPETISVNLDEDGNSYKYQPYDDIQYGIDVIALEDFPSDLNKKLEIVESWHRNIVSAATKVKVDDIKFSKGTKEHTPYLYSSYPLKKGLMYYQLTLSKYNRIYYLKMYLHGLEHSDKSDLNKIFFEFVDSFKFTKK